MWVTVGNLCFKLKYTITERPQGNAENQHNSPFLKWCNLNYFYNSILNLKRVMRI
jgi:hypothetical protein